jgi:hypothetical protein
VEAEREKREKILYPSFLCVFVICGVLVSLQMNSSRLCNTFRTKIKRQKRRRRKFDDEFFPREREERSRSFSSD